MVAQQILRCYCKARRMFSYEVSGLGGRWPGREHVIKCAGTGISQKTRTRCLRPLERKGLILRRVLTESPWESNTLHEAGARWRFR
jgi:hypothetical protein